MTDLTFIHWSEYQTTLADLRSLSPQQLCLLDHIGEVKLAAVTCWTEFFLMNLSFPGIMFGLLWIVGGICLWNMSFFKIRANFNHTKQSQRDEQVLITGGMFRIYRHSNQMDWFAWNLGIQMAIRKRGLNAGFSKLLTICRTHLCYLDWYVTALIIFLLSEYWITAPAKLKSSNQQSLSSGHSQEDTLTAVAGCAGFSTQYLILLGLKPLALKFGLLWIVGSECLRKMSIFKVKGNFNHQAKQIRRNEHMLMTQGVFRMFRHPYYKSWFLWKLGPQQPRQRKL